MNSTSSTDSAALKGRATIQPWQFYLTASFLGAAAVVWLSPPADPVALIFISLAVFAAGASAAAFHSALSAFTGRRSREVEVREGLRAALEREKLLALRAIKDLQFDTAMGKVSAADAAPMEARLRERAAAIIEQLDGRAELKARIERDLAARQIAGQGPEAGGRACPACGTVNTVDAKFCKECGSRL